MWYKDIFKYGFMNVKNTRPARPVKVEISLGRENEEVSMSSIVNLAKGITQ